MFVNFSQLSLLALLWILVADAVNLLYSWIFSAVGFLLIFLCALLLRAVALAHSSFHQGLLNLVLTLLLDFLNWVLLTFTIPLVNCSCS